MKRVRALSDDRGVCLATPKELLDGLPPRERWTEEGLRKTLTDLKMDAYFDLLYTERKGECTYVITLREAGQAFLQADRPPQGWLRNARRNICF